MQSSYLAQPILLKECIFEKLVRCTTTKSKLNIQVFTTTEALPANWDLIIDSELLKKDVLAVTEKSAIKDFNFYYVCFYKEEELVGAAYFQLLQVNKNHYPDFSARDVVSKRVYNYISKRKYPLLVAGHLFFNNFKSYSFKPEINKTDYSKAYFSALNSIQRYSKAKIVLMKEFEGELKQSPLNNGFIAMSEDYFMQMNIPSEWKITEDYIAALSKKYQARIKKINTEIAPLAIIELTIDEISANDKLIEKLYLNVTKKASVKLGILNASFFIELKKALSDNFKFFGYFLNDELIAFSTGFITKNTYETYYIGADEAKCKDFGVYQHLLVMGVEKAIENKKEILALGRTALEAKAIIGCKPRLIPNYIKFNNRLLQLGASLIISAFYQQNGMEWEKRNPFKK
jgi:predicted N-acyltransferase